MHGTTAGFLPEALVLHIPELDSQHEALFMQLAALKSCCFETGCLPADRTDEMLAALWAHFATEEQLARTMAMPFAEHAGKHQELLDTLARAFAEVQEGRREVFSLLRYIDYWFERHISDDDRHFGTWLGRHPSATATELQAA